MPANFEESQPTPFANSAVDLSVKAVPISDFSNWKYLIPRTAETIVTIHLWSDTARFQHQLRIIQATSLLCHKIYCHTEVCYACEVSVTNRITADLCETCDCWSTAGPEN